MPVENDFIRYYFDVYHINLEKFKPDNPKYLLLQDSLATGIEKLTIVDFVFSTEITFETFIEAPDCRIRVEASFPCAVETEKGQLFVVIPNPQLVKVLAQIVLDAYYKTKDFLSKQQVNLDVLPNLQHDHFEAAVQSQLEQHYRQ